MITIKKHWDCYVCEDGQLDDACKECCPHDWDDYCCNICGAEKDMGSLIDAAEYSFDPER